MALLTKVKYAAFGNTPEEQDDVYTKKQEVVLGSGAPYLVPTGKNADYNVWKNEDYLWSISPKGVTDYIPYIRLEEFRLKYSSELLSLINSARGLQEAFSRADLFSPQTNNELISLLQGAVATAGGLSFASSDAFKAIIDSGARVATRGRGIGGATGKVLGGLIDSPAAGFGASLSLSRSIQATLADPDALLLGFSETRKNEALMDPYTGLYYATPTNINYTLPYISIDNMVEINSTWSEPGKEGPVSRALQLSKDLLTKSGAKGVGAGLTTFDLFAAAAESAAFAGEPGSGREKIKGFAPPENGDSVSLSFFLYNTLRADVIQKNWEFLYVLNYQNLPNRRSINLLDPPCVYRVQIPGYKRFPIAAIEKLKVENVGLTRYIDLTNGSLTFPGNAIGSQNSANVKMIPEAYKVTMTVRSLLTATQNLFQWSDSQTNAVNVFLQSAQK